MEGDTSYFHDDMASARQDIAFTAAYRTKILATEIGECTMAIDLAALMSQKRNLENENNTDNHIHAKIKKQKNTKDTRALTEKKISMRTLVFNLFAGIFSERTAEELTQMTLPTNAIYIFNSSTLAQEKKKEQLHNEISLGLSGAENCCECLQSIRNIQSNTNETQRQNVEDFEEIAKAHGIIDPNNEIVKDSFWENQKFPQPSFDVLWNVIETMKNLYKIPILTDNKAIGIILHKHAMGSGSIHKSISYCLPLHDSEYELACVEREENKENTEGNKENLCESKDTVKKIDEGFIWIHGIRYYILGNNLENKGDNPNHENIRKQIDPYMLRLERGIKAAIDALSVNSEESAIFLEQQLGLLADYIKESHNRVIIQQVVDELMRPLLKLKNKFIEYACQNGMFNFMH